MQKRTAVQKKGPTPKRTCSSIVTEGMPQSANWQNNSAQQEKDIPLTHGDIPAIVEAVGKSMQKKPSTQEGVPDARPQRHFARLV